MGRIEEIKESLKIVIEHEAVVGSLTPEVEEYKEHVSYLLSLIQIAEEAIQNAIDAGKGSDPYETKTILEILKDALEQIHKEDDKK